MVAPLSQQEPLVQKPQESVQQLRCDCHGTKLMAVQRGNKIVVKVHEHYLTIQVWASPPLTPK